MTDDEDIIVTIRNLIGSLRKRTADLETRVSKLQAARTQRAVSKTHVDAQGRLVVTYADGSEEAIGPMANG